MSGWYTSNLVKNIYNDSNIAPEEIDTVHKILDLFRPDAELEIDYDSMWDESRKTYVSRLTGLSAFINHRLRYFYEYDFTRDKL